MAVKTSATGLAQEAFSLIKGSEEAMLSDENRNLMVLRGQGIAMLAVAEMLAKIESQLSMINDHLMSVVSEIGVIADNLNKEG